MGRLTAAIIGMGERGRIHLYGFLKNPEYFQVAGVCDRNQSHLEEAVKEYGISEDICYNDARLMLQKVRPDILAFVTMPHIRLSLAELAAEYKVRGLMFEKPMATSLGEADKIRKLCMENKIKTAVCHQHKYVSSFMRLKEAIDSGELGEICEMKASCQPQASQLGTHYIDYLLWANGGKRVLSVAGHVHGNFYLEDSHPSPDYVMGQMISENGVRMILECGYFAARHEEHDVGFTHGPAEAAYWTDDRLTVYGTKGYAWASCNGKYAVFSPRTSPDIRAGDYHGFFEKEQYDAQVRYARDFADWVNGERESHPCSLDQAYHGYEILEAMYISAVRHTRVDLPVKLPLQYDTLEILRNELGPVNYRRFQKR